MNSKRKKKIAAAAMAFTSIFGAKNSNAAPKAGNIAILENSDEQNLPQSENKTKNDSEKLQNTNDGTLIASCLAVLVAAGLITHAAWPNNKKTDADNDNTDDNKGKKYNNPDILIKKDAKKVWENDPHGIIKFLTWGDGYLGTCIRNSCFNMFLNPVFMESADTYLDRFRNFYQANSNNYKQEYRNHKIGINCNRCYHCNNDYTDKEHKYDNCDALRKFEKLDLYTKISAIKDIWDATQSESQKQEYINIEATSQDDPFYDVYVNAWDFYSRLTRVAPDLFGNLTTMGKGIEKNNTPPLLMVNGSDFNPSNKRLVNFRKSNELTCYQLNEQEYFVSGAVLRIHDGHSVYAHLLYNNNNQLSRVIIQDANPSSNRNKDGYVYEIDVDIMKRMLKGENVNGYRLYDFALLIRKDKFEQHKNYWNENSLPREGIRRRNI